LIIEALAKKKQVFASEIYEVKREINRLQSELKGIQILEDKALAEELERNSWMTYAYSSIFGPPKEPEGAKEERDMQRLHRRASKTIKEDKLSKMEDKLKGWNKKLSGVEKEIATEVSKRNERAMRAEREKQEAKRQEEAKARRKRQEEFMEQVRVRQAAAEAEAAQERAAVEAYRRAAEVRRKKEEDRRKREAKEAEEMQKRRDEMMRKLRAASQSTAPRQDGARAGASWASRTTPSASASAAASCHHRGWWDKVEHGSLMCENCHTAQRRFLFQCPDCRMKACADCRISLKKDGNPRRTPRTTQPRTNTRTFNPPPPYEEEFGYDWYD
jgi:hypothetical protein